MNENGNSRYLPIEADEDLEEEDVAQEERLPSTELAPVKKPIKLFEMSVWKESNGERDGVVLSSYIEQLFNDGYTPEQIAQQVQLPVVEVKRKLNKIVNSFLGAPSTDARGLRRLEVDECLLNQLSFLHTSLSKYLEKCEDEGLIPDVQVVTKLQAQITKLLEVRVKLWGLEGGTEVAKKAGSGKEVGVYRRESQSIDKETGDKIANLIIGVVTRDL